MSGLFAPYFEILRPKLWIPSFVSTFIGYIFALNLHLPSSSFSSFHLLVALLITGPLIGGGALVLNQYFDFEEDKYSSKRKRYTLVAGDIDKKSALAYAFVLLAIGILFAFFINLDVFTITLITTLLSILYSTPPVRFKKRLFLDSMTNGVCYGILPTSVGFTIVAPFSLESLIISFPLFLGYTGGHMLLAIPDIENDKMFGLRTSAVVLGYKNTVVVATSLFLSMIVVLCIYIYMKILPLSSLVILPIGVYILKEHVELLRMGEGFQKNIYDRLSLEFLLMVIIFLFVLALPLLAKYS